MDALPDAWPPTPTHRIYPLFPLPNVWLFPYVILPLHIFEERYKRMIEDHLDGPGRLVLGTVQQGHENELEGSPPIYSIAGLGEIGRHDRVQDGRFNILLVGLRRVRVSEVASDRPYRLVEVEPTEEAPVAPERDQELRQRLVKSIIERTHSATSIPPNVPISHLADLLALGMSLPHEVLNKLFCELDPESRANMALAEHAIRPRTPKNPDPNDPGPGSSGAG